MRRFFSFLASAPVSGLIAAAILIGAVLLLRPLLPFLDGWVGWTIIGVVAFLYLLLVGLWLLRRRRRNREMLAEIAEPEPDPDGEAIDAESADLQAKFASAMSDLSKLRFRSKTHGTRMVYELPWYIFIGPPGAGKTEALKNCGLEFPLRKGDGAISIDGGAGTRDCDWVFTNEAVFIDTAGRYTTQGSNKSVDQAGWTSFLDLLKRYRPREPVNGVIVAISLSDIATSSEEDLDAYAQSVRARVQELYERMEARIPVYVMFTKADLIVGFTEFFEAMRPGEREQVWGHTFPIKDVDAEGQSLKGHLASIGPELDALLEQLGEMQFKRLQDEPDLGTRSRIFGFPAQFASLKPVISRFMERAFGPDRYSTPTLLRGFYFTSATQIGQPVDRLIAGLSREFGVEHQAVATLGGAGGRSYFLSDLLKKVVFPEQGLVAMTARKRSEAGRWAAIAASILLPIAVAGGLFLVYRHNEAQAASFATAVEEYEKEVAALPEGGDPVDDHDFLSVLPALDRLRAEAERLGSEDAEAPLLGMGVDDTPALESQARAAYGQALDDLLRTRLMYRSERLIERTVHKPAELYAVLKTYLMTAGQAPEVDAEFIREQWLADWRDTYDPVVDGEALVSLLGHLDAMLEPGILDPLELNGEAVALARDALSQISPAERAYLSMVSSAEARELEPWNPAQAGGRSTEKVLTRLSGKPLDAPIPGLYTYNGYWTYFVPQVTVAAKRAQEETWLLADDPTARQPKLGTIIDEMATIYAEDYVEAWRDMLADLRIVPFRDADHAAEVLVSLSGGTSPLKRITEAVAAQTGIDKVPGEDSAVFDKAKARGSQQLRQRGLLGEALDAFLKEGGPRYGEPVAESFEDIETYASGGIASLMEALQRFYVAVSDIAAGGGELETVTLNRPAQELRNRAKVAPVPLNQIVLDMIDQANEASATGIRAALAEVWRSSVMPVCRDRLHGRYPFGRGAEIPLGDLSAVLGPKGVLDEFFEGRMKPFVNTDVSPWRWRGGVGQTLGIAQDRLYFFERAHRLREALFPNDAPEPIVRIGVYPVALEPGVSQARLSVGGASATFAPDKEQPGQVSWPGPQPDVGAAASLQVEGVTDAVTGELQVDELPALSEGGPWGLFRLVDRLGWRPIGDDRGRIRYTIGGLSVSLELRMNASENPFSLREEMRAFRCPDSL